MDKRQSLQGKRYTERWTATTETMKLELFLMQYTTLGENDLKIKFKT